jgi:sec-independent protein translocase protein TatA
MFGLSFLKLLVIMFLVLVVFGTRRLPEIGGAIGKGIKSFKQSMKESNEIDVTPKKGDGEKQKSS